MAAAPQLDLTTYSFRKILGIGSSSIVCQYMKDDIFYAIKFIPSVNFSTIIQREIAVLTQLNQYDLSIPKIYDHGLIITPPMIKEFNRNKEYYAIVMEFIDGITLEDYLDMDSASIRNVAIWIFDLLRRLHALNIVHRDIKPANIIFTPDQTLYLVDFGFACSIQDKLMLCSHDVIGTPNYIGPEGWSGIIENLNMFKSLDIWAAGVTLYYLEFGEVPWYLSDTDLNQPRELQRSILKHKILTQPLPFIPNLNVTTHALSRTYRPTATELFLESTTP